jgi:DNA polymerase III delta' subunit
MPFSNPLLVSHLKRGRIAHTYLFSGSKGDRRKELVLGFARALNCLEQRIFEDCSCLSCRKITGGNHPDVRRYGEDEKSRSIKIEAVREMIHEASLKPYEGRWKVFLLEGAERLTLEAANALLKTLEEPPEHSVFFLLVENKAHLLETIQSRAFEIRIPPSEGEGEKGEAVLLLKEKGWGPLWEYLRDLTRNELQEELETLMGYLRDCSVAAWKEDSGRSERYLKALERVYETKEAVDANVNQKLALTYLEIGLQEVSNG